MRRFFITSLSVALLVAATPTYAAVPSFPHLQPSSYMAPMVPGFFQLTWVGQYQTPPRPEFSNIPTPETIDQNMNWAVAVFPRCNGKIQVRCIQKIEYKVSENWKEADFSSYLPVTTPAFTDRVNRNRYVNWASKDLDVSRNAKIPLDSARSSLWEVEISGEKKLYMADVTIQYDILQKWFSGFAISLTPVREVWVEDSIEYKDMDPEKTWCARTGYPDSFFMYNNFNPLTENKPNSDIYDYCLIKEKFATDTLFRVTTQLSAGFEEKSLANWVTSRTTQTRAYTVKSAQGEQTLAIFEGQAAKVQAGVTQIPHTEEGFRSWLEGSSFKKAIAEGTVTETQLRDSFRVGDPNAQGGESHYGAGWESINQWKSTEKYIDPILTLEQELWQFSVITLDSDGDKWVSKCDKVRQKLPSFSGVISTNATVFVQGPPRLTDSGELDFQVAATHQKENGEPNLGSYHLSIAEQMAECIWGSAELGIGASISVISEDGTTQVAATSVGKSNGQISFSASGFHYSTNKVRVSIGQIKSSTKPSNKLKKLTISCSKGKLVKKITDINPKCPSGFKRLP